jgi:CBS domain-containing protein
MLVWERMTRNPYTVTADIAVPDALRRMHKLQVRRFPVVDAKARWTVEVGKRSQEWLMKMFLLVYRKFRQSLSNRHRDPRNLRE